MINLKTIFFFLLLCYLSSCSLTKDTEVSKISDKGTIDNKTIIYALPQTVIYMRLELTKTIIKKGPYAEYAKKYLDLSGVPLKDSETWDISDVKIWPAINADQSQYYTLTYKKYPENLSKLFSLSNNGIVLDYTGAWKGNMNKTTSEENKELLFDPNITDEISKEQVDTFYKTIVTDTSFVRLPVFKKQIQIKNIEELAKEEAHELIKTRKRKLKLLRGEYEFHPDGKTLEVMINKMEEQEKKYMVMFTGITVKEKYYNTYTFAPQLEDLSREMCYFTNEEGVNDTKTEGSLPVILQVMRETVSFPGVNPKKSQNSLYVRFPIMTSVIVKMDNEQIAEAKLPVYQFSPVQIMPLKP
jgi:hypothetical protein